MEYIKLKDLCEKEERFVAPNDDAHIDYVDISSVDNKSKSLTKYDTYIFAEAPSRARKRVKNGDVIVSTVRPNLNAVARFNIQTPHTPIASTGFCVLRHKSDVDPIYIYFFCISPNFVRQMVAKATGASYPAVSDTIVREAKLPKHTAEKRFRIVSTLSKAKEIIEHRRAQLAKLDELVKCRFVEMFGRSSTSPYPTATLRDIATIKHGYAFKGEFFTKASNGIVLVTPGNFKVGGGFQELECRYFSGDYPDEYVLELGSLIVTMTDLSKNADTLGYAALIPEHSNKVYLHNQRIGLIYLKPCMNKYFVCHYMQTEEYRRKIVSTATGSTVHHTSPARILDSAIMLPPLSLQKEFENFVRRIDKLRFFVRLV